MPGYTPEQQREIFEKLGITEEIIEKAKDGDTDAEHSITMAARNAITRGKDLEHNDLTVEEIVFFGMLLSSFVATLLISKSNLPMETKFEAQAHFL
ncbi:MAG: hypothetical protein ABFQ62_00850 [Patescibacteria group bacterium]